MAEFIVNPAEITPPIDIVCGNAEAEIIKFVFDRHGEGVDLAGLAWAVTVKNSTGFSDVYMQDSGIFKVEDGDDTISVYWKLYGTATAAAGRLLYQLEGLRGKAVIKRFPVRVFNIVSYLSTQLSADAEEDHSQLRDTIEYVGNELPKILAEEAERQRRFALIDLYVERTGKIVRVTAVNTDGEETVASIFDGKDFVLRGLYETLDELIAAHPKGYLGDAYVVGRTDKNTIYIWDVNTDTWRSIGSLPISMPAEIVVDNIVTRDGKWPVSGEAVWTFCGGGIPTPETGDAGKALIVLSDGTYGLGTIDVEQGVVDDTVTQAGKNAVTGSAVWKFAGGGIPTPTPENAGLVIKVQEDGSYGLGEAGLSEVSADIVTAGTFMGAVKANATAVADVTVVQIRNVACGTADVADVLGDLNVGDLYFTVEEAT